MAPSQARSARKSRPLALAPSDQNPKHLSLSPNRGQFRHQACPFHGRRASSVHRSLPLSRSPKWRFRTGTPRASTHSLHDSHSPGFSPPPFLRLHLHISLSRPTIHTLRRPPPSFAPRVRRTSCRVPELAARLPRQPHNTRKLELNSHRSSFRQSYTNACRVNVRYCMPIDYSYLLHVL
jgi:hypothetical protein